MQAFDYSRAHTVEEAVMQLGAAAGHARVLAGVLPDRFGLAMARIEPYGLIILVLLLGAGLFNVLMPIVNSIRHLILTLFSSFF